MESRFRMQVVDAKTGDVIQWEPGKSVETDLVADIISRIVAKGVGFFRTSNHVQKDIEDGLHEAIFELKKKVPPRV